MVKPNILSQHHATFEGIRQLDEAGNEFWSARQLAKVLEYSQYRHFLAVVEKAREPCRNSDQAVADHMEDILTMVDIGYRAKRLPLHAVKYQLKQSVSAGRGLG